MSILSSIYPHNFVNNYGSILIPKNVFDFCPGKGGIFPVGYDVRQVNNSFCTGF